MKSKEWNAKEKPKFILNVITENQREFLVHFKEISRHSGDLTKYLKCNEFECEKVKEQMKCKIIEIVTKTE